MAVHLSLVVLLPVRRRMRRTDRFPARSNGAQHRRGVPLISLTTCPAFGRERPNAVKGPRSETGQKLRLELPPRLQLQTEDGGLSYWASAIFGPDDSICALAAEGRFDGDAGSGDREAASGGAPWDGRRATVPGSTITFAPTFTRS